MNGGGAEQRKAMAESRVRFSQFFLLAVFALTTVVFYRVMKPFLVLLVLAAVFATLFYPVYQWTVRLCRGNRGWAALASVILFLIGLLIPVIIVANIVVAQAIGLYAAIAPHLQEWLGGSQGLFERFRHLSIVQWLLSFNINWKAAFQSSLSSLGASAAGFINSASQATIEVIVDTFVLLFIMFYFFRDGPGFIAYVKGLIPMEDRYKGRVIERFVSISRATVKGTLVIGLIQGGAGALTFLIFGISAWLLWGVVMVIFAIVPVLGAWTVMVPAGLIEIFTGNVVAGLTMIIISVVVVSSIDNVLRPRLVGKDAGMHDLLVFCSTIGGLVVFGMMGFIVGPVVAAFFLTLLDIYREEFREKLR